MNRIRELRKALGLTQDQLAEHAAIGRNTLQRYEATSFSGRIATDIRQRIADALRQPVDSVFPTQQPTNYTIDRRQLLTSALEIGLLGMGAAFSPFATLGLPASGKKRLNASELQTLIDDNYATWQLLDATQRGATIDYVHAVAQGKLVVLRHLAHNALPEQQKQMVLTLFGDMHILLGRLHRDRQNFADAEHYFLGAMQIADELHHLDLKTAAMIRYGNMILLDQARHVAAARNAEAMLEVSKRASHPVWAEAQLMAGMAIAYVGRYDEARRLAYTARQKHGPDSEIWVGAIINPKALYSDFDLITSLAVKNYHTAYQASVDAIALIDQEQPEVLHWRLNIEAMQAQALWGIGDLEGTIDAATHCLERAKLIDSTATANRLEQLYVVMLQSRYGKHPAIRRFGETILA